MRDLCNIQGLSSVRFIQLLIHEMKNTVEIVRNSSEQQSASSLCKFDGPPEEVGALPATAGGVTVGEVCCSLDGSGSPGLWCCDGPKGTVVLLSRSWPAYKGVSVNISLTSWEVHVFLF